MSKLLDSLHNKFDKVYLLTMVNREDRQYNMCEQLEKMNLPLPDETNYLRYYYGTAFPFNNIIADAFNKSGKGRFTKANEYDCARNHYAMIKICYELGYEHCLIIEDDLLFLKDADKIAEYIDNLPDDYDIAQFGGFTTDKNILNYCHSITEDNNNKYWTKHKQTGVWTTSMYAMSRKGMQFFLTFMDSKLFWVADGPLYYAPRSEKIINTYISRIPLVIQADKNTVESDIRDENNDKINYNTENAYESEINLSDYHTFSKLADK